MLSDVIKKLIECQPDMQVVGEVLDPIELLIAVKATPVDVVIVTPLEANAESRICRHLLEEHPTFIILTVSAKGEAVCLYRSGCDKKYFDEASWQSILGAMRESIKQT
jgi:DNA-binding NarL/FixJ family response regulator